MNKQRRMPAPVTKPVEQKRPTSATSGDTSNSAMQLKAKGNLYGADSESEMKGPNGSYNLGKGAAAKGSLFDNTNKIGGQEMKQSIGEAEGKFGQWRDEDGATTVGAEVGGHIHGSETTISTGFGDDAKVTTKTGDVSAGGQLNKNGVSGGATATIAEAGAKWGTGPNKDKGTDTTGGVSVGVGVGMQGGLNFGDKDGDGVREVGLSGGIGIVGFDFESELLGQGVNYAEKGISAIGSLF
ncbi:MAG: hypothetical protein AB8H79_01575 [Myxococcota bacterium]